MVNMGDREIIVKRNGPVLYPHYKELANGNILFGVGTEYTEHGMLVIGINRWKIIKSNVGILDKNQLLLFRNGISADRYNYCLKFKIKFTILYSFH